MTTETELAGEDKLVLIEPNDTAPSIEIVQHGYNAMTTETRIDKKLYFKENAKAEPCCPCCNLYSGTLSLLLLSIIGSVFIIFIMTIGWSNITLINIDNESECIVINQTNNSQSHSKYYYYDNNTSENENIYPYSCNMFRNAFAAVIGFYIVNFVTSIFGVCALENVIPCLLVPQIVFQIVFVLLEIIALVGAMINNISLGILLWINLFGLVLGCYFIFVYKRIFRIVSRITFFF